jgi:hypothetical protein
MDRRSQLGSVLRITAYVFRFIRLVKQKASWTRSKRQAKVTIGCRGNLLDYINHGNKVVEPPERQEALEYWIRISQAAAYPREIKALKTGESLDKTSKLLSLAPRWRNEMVVVGGRLAEANGISIGQKEPIVIPQDSELARKLIQEAHIKTLHGGAQLMIQYLRANYWIVCLRRMVKQHATQCVRCVRQRQITAQQQMADLPSSRVNPARPFKFCGCDYAGPITLKPRSGRNSPKT